LKKLLAEVTMDVLTPREMLGKISYARLEEESRELGECREGVLSEACLRPGRHRADNITKPRDDAELQLASAQDRSACYFSSQALIFPSSRLKSTGLVS
jgi:hypothetical protein